MSFLAIGTGAAMLFQFIDNYLEEKIKRNNNLPEHDRIVHPYGKENDVTVKRSLGEEEEIEEDYAAHPPPYNPNELMATAPLPQKVQEGEGEPVLKQVEDTIGNISLPPCLLVAVTVQKYKKDKIH